MSALVGEVTSSLGTSANGIALAAIGAFGIAPSRGLRFKYSIRHESLIKNKIASRARLLAFEEEFMSFVDFAASVTKTPASDETSISLMGPIVQWIATPEATGEQFSVQTGVIAPGISVPLHAHPDAELTFVLDGQIEILSYKDGEPYWLPLQKGESALHPSGARHALRNVGNEPCYLLVATTASMGRFFEEIGRPVLPGQTPPQPDAEWIDIFAQAAARRGYWTGSPADNAAIGLI